MEDILGDVDEEVLKQYKCAETIENGDGTVSGFQIDTSLNPTVSYKVKKDGKEIELACSNLLKWYFSNILSWGYMKMWFIV